MRMSVVSFLLASYFLSEGIGVRHASCLVKPILLSVLVPNNLTLSSKKRYERTRTRDEQKTKVRTTQALLDLQSSQNEMSDEEAAETGATSYSQIKLVLKD
jgi:hypothetical protein